MNQQGFQKAGFVQMKNRQSRLCGYYRKFVIAGYDLGSIYFLRGYATVLKDRSNLLSSTGIQIKRATFKYANGDYRGQITSAEGLYAVCKEGSEPWGYIDHTGEYVIDSQFQLMFSEGLARIFPVKAWDTQIKCVVIKLNVDLTSFSEGLHWLLKKYLR